jgi:hypothetical protein
LQNTPNLLQEIMRCQWNYPSFCSDLCSPT